MQKAQSLSGEPTETNECIILDLETLTAPHLSEAESHSFKWGKFDNFNCLLLGSSILSKIKGRSHD